MGCNCGGNRAARRNVTVRPDTVTAAADAVNAASKVYYEVWRNGRYTGRRSDSLVSATNIAERLGGEVRTAT